MKSFLGLMLIVAVVVGMGVSSAAANCNPAQSASTQEQGAGISYYAYLYFTNTDEANFDGGFWQTGQGNTMNQGGMPITQWLKGYPGFVLFDINLGDGAVVGCPAQTDPNAKMTVQLNNRVTGEGVVMTVQRNSTPPFAVDFSFSNRFAPSIPFQITPGNSARTRINNSSKTPADVVTVNASVLNLGPSVFDATGGAGAITATQIYQRRFPNNQTPPTGNPAGWLPIASTLTSGAGGIANTTIPNLDCTGLDSNRDDLWLATGMTISGEVRICCPVQIECGGNLADPTGPNRKLIRPVTPKQNPQQ